MAFTAITTAEITTGEPVAFDLWTKVKDDLDDHESRLAGAENTIIKPFPYVFEVKGPYYLGGTVSAVAYIRMQNAITLSAAQIFVPTAGTSGTLEIDIQYKRGVSAFATIFTTRPSVAFGAGNFAVSSNGVLSVTDIEAGDILRLDIVSVQQAHEEFHVYLPYTVT